MSIYTSSQVCPYVYKLTHKETGQFYFGYQEQNKVPSSDSLGKIYFTSSKTISKMGFHSFDYIIVAEFINPDRKVAGDNAWQFEQEIIRDNFSDPLNLNKYFCIGTKNKFKNIGECSPETRAKLSYAARNCSPETRAKHSANKKASKGTQKRTPEQCKRIADSQRGKTQSKEHCAKISESLKGNTFSSKKWVLKFLDGREDVITLKLKEWCNANNVKYQGILASSKLNQSYEGIYAVSTWDKIS